MIQSDSIKVVSSVRITWFLALSLIAIAAAYYLSFSTYFNLFDLILPLLCGATLFCIYAPTLSEHICTRDCAMDFCLFGVTFIIWGFIAGVCLGGIYGLIHALFCVVLYWSNFGTRLITISPIVLLVPSWLLAIITEQLLIPFAVTTNRFTLLVTSAVIAWNAMMFLCLALTARRDINKRHHASKILPCHNCGYSLVGLTSDRCPECGTELVSSSTPAAANAQESHQAHSEH